MYVGLELSREEVQLQDDTGTETDRQSEQAAGTGDIRIANEV
jgi:hypothetical protein